MRASKNAIQGRSSHIELPSQFAAAQIVEIQRDLDNERMTICGTSLRRFLAPDGKPAWPKQAFAAHDVQNEHAGAFLPIKDAAGRFDNLSVAPSLQLRWL